MFDPTSHAQQWPNKPAVVMGETGESLSYAELDENSARLAQLFWAQGLRPGDHVAVLLENQLRFFETYWAAVRSGLLFTAVNSHLTAGEVGYIVNDCDAALLISSAALAGVAEQIVDGTPKVRRRLMIDGASPSYEDYDAALARHPATPLEQQPLGRQMLYSSGSTGRPKGVWRPLSGRAYSDGMAALVPIYRDMFNFGPETVFLVPAPLYHGGPLIYGASVLSLGGTVVVMNKFTAEGTLALIERHRINRALFVPTMFNRLLALPDDVRHRYDVSSMELIIHGAAPCPVHIKRAMIEWFGPIFAEFYAGTEDSGATVITSEEWLERPGSVGRGVAGAVVHVCDESGRELPPGEIGQVWFEGPAVVADFQYYGDEMKTIGAHHPEHPTWSALGDLGRLDEDGFLYLADRQAFMIIAGGVNIYPQEIEDVLLQHPEVQDVAVFGVPDPDLGEQVKAIVQPAPGSTPGPELTERILAFSAVHLARFKIPRSIDYLEDFPRTPTGKLRKTEMREPHWAGHGSRIL